MTTITGLGWGWAQPESTCVCFWLSEGARSTRASLSRELGRVLPSARAHPFPLRRGPGSACFLPDPFSAAGQFLVHHHKIFAVLGAESLLFFTDSPYSFTNFSCISTITHVSITHKIPSLCSPRLAKVLKAEAYFIASFNFHDFLFVT